MPLVSKTPLIHDFDQSIGKSVPQTGGGRAVAGWLWQLLLARDLEFYGYDKASKSFSVAVTPEENAGQGTDAWAAKRYTIDECFELCRNLDPMLTHVPAQRVETIRKKLPCDRVKRSTVTDLRRLLAEVLDAHGDSVLLEGEWHARITAAIA